MADRPDIADLLPMTAVEFMVLLVLTDGTSHGYAIVKEIEQRTDGQVSLLPGNLYAILQRLTASGLIARTKAAAAATKADKRRRNYRITPFGRKVAAAEAERMRQLVEAAAARDLIEDTAR